MICDEFRMILQMEENKGVEFTVHVCMGSGAWKEGEESKGTCRGKSKDPTTNPRIATRLSQGS
jgi:hypothetical protein